MIHQKRGIERLRIFFTGFRGYLCRDCDHAFRAPDRRSVRRDGKLGVSAIPRQV
jgi:hypothetical protein